MESLGSKKPHHLSSISTLRGIREIRDIREMSDALPYCLESPAFRL
ncbi:hypothetical protein VPHF86_0317 [Vibrio phage F86]